MAASMPKGSGGVEVQASPGSRQFQMKKASSGHWMIPVSHFGKQQQSCGITLTTRVHDIAEWQAEHRALSRFASAGGGYIPPAALNQMMPTAEDIAAGQMAEVFGGAPPVQSAVWKRPRADTTASASASGVGRQCPACQERGPSQELLGSGSPESEEPSPRP